MPATAGRSASIEASSQEHADRRPIARLRRVATALARLEQPHPGDGAWLVAAVARYEAAQICGMSLDLGAAMGLGAPGRRSWLADERRARRDELLRELRSRHLAHLSAGQAAAVILKLVGQIGARGTQAAAGDDRMGLLVEAMTTGQPIPGLKQLTRLLAGLDINSPSQCPVATSSPGSTFCTDAAPSRSARRHP